MRLRPTGCLLLGVALLAALATFGCSDDPPCEPSANGYGVSSAAANAAVVYRLGGQISPVRKGQVYLDLSESMRGFISDEGSKFAFTPLQRMLDGVLVEAFANAGVSSPEVAGFGKYIKRGISPLQTYAVQGRRGKSPKSRYSESNTDLARVMADAAQHPEALSVIVTDGDQDMRSEAEAGGDVGPGFVRSWLIDELAGDIIGRHFGVWLLGVMSAFDDTGCYYTVMPDSHGKTGNCLNIRRRPILVWVFSRDPLAARRLVDFLLSQLRQTTRPVAGTKSVAGSGEVGVIEIWPGNDLQVGLDIIPPARLQNQSFLEQNSLTDVFRWQTGTMSSRPFFACLGFDAENVSPVILPLELERSYGVGAGKLGLPPEAWRPLLPVSPEGGLTERHDLVLSPAPSSVGLLLSLPHEKALRAATKGALNFPVRFDLDLSSLDDHWIRRWSSVDDTSATAIEGRTLFLWDTVAGTLQRAWSAHEPEVYLQIRLSAR